MSSRQAQLVLNETILVIIIVAILLILGLVFFHRFNIQSIDQDIREHERQEFAHLLTIIPNSPEIQCSTQLQELPCIDSLKLFGFKDVSKSYFDRFGYKKIAITVVYPELPHEECTKEKAQLASYPNCNLWIIYERKPASFAATEKLSTAVTLYYPLSDEYKIAIMELEWYHS